MVYLRNIKVAGVVGENGRIETLEREAGQGLSYSLAKGGNLGPTERQSWPKVPH